MSSIIISSDSSATAARFAGKIADRTGRRCVGREVLAKAAETYGVPENLLIKALDSPPSFFGMSAKTRKLHLAYVQAAVLEELAQDEAVCHGLGAHLYARGVSHFLKVRILTDPEALAKELFPNRSIAPGRLARMLAHEESASRRWSMEAFKLDETKAGQYDLVVSLSNIDEDEAVEMVEKTVQHRKFAPMTYSLNCIRDLSLAAQVRARLIIRFPECRVRAMNQTVVVHIKALKRHKRKNAALVKEIAGAIPGVSHVEVHTVTDIIGQALER